MQQTKESIEGFNNVSAPFSQDNIKMIPGLLNGKVALITGSSDGIGKSIAETFVQHGAKVVINGRKPDPCHNLANKINNECTEGVEALACPCDVMDQKAVQAMVNKTIDTFGKIDILVNNAGTSRDALIHKMDDKLLRFIIDLAIKGTYNTTKAIIPHFLDETKHSKDAFKKIINFSSTTGVSGNVGQSNYALAKGGVIGYSKACARELCLERINVNCVAPGFTHTRMTQLKTNPDDEVGVPEGVLNLAIAATPFVRHGRAGEPYHNAWVVLFLASYLSDWVTGQVITIDGGLYI
ncbi:MAG: SDR family NAD(P)-dependent oxidoreductase [Promethearchaeota archaeon]